MFKTLHTQGQFSHSPTILLFILSALLVNVIAHTQCHNLGSLDKTSTRHSRNTNCAPTLHRSLCASDLH
ncbi:hypothetical protein M758_UG302000 [Ceratodon purpureus]|nr:hypothetical protein M758_UG302000 [Ceratodon purpureus]